MSLKMSSLFLNILQIFKLFLLIFKLILLNFKNSSDQRTPLTCCFRKNQSIDLKIKMHFLLIYAKSLKSNFERVHFSVMSGGGEIMAGRVCWRQNYGWSWLVMAGGGGGGGKIMAGWWRQTFGWSWVVATKLWLVVGGRGWSHDLVMPDNYFIVKCLLKLNVVSVILELPE